MSPASGDRGSEKRERGSEKRVSIQLMSPASGDLVEEIGLVNKKKFPFN